MTAILLPSSPGIVGPTSPRLIDAGGLLEPSLPGGEMQRVERLGSRHALDVSLPPMLASTAMPWIQRLKRGKNDRVVLAFPQPGFDPGTEGTPKIRTDAAGGATTIDIKGVTASNAASEGQSFSIVHAGQRYVYSFDAAAIAASAGPAITNQANTSVGLAGDIYTIEKTAGGAAWNASAASTTLPLCGDFVLRAKASQANKGLVVGVNADPVTDNDWPGIDRGIYFRADGLVETVESSARTVEIAYATSDYWFLRRRGSVIEALSGTSSDVANATLRRTMTSLAGDVHFDSSFNDVGGIVQVLFVGWVLNGMAITPALRTAITAGDVVELAVPMIEGYPVGDATAWDVNEAAHYGLQFTIVEAA